MSWSESRIVNKEKRSSSKYIMTYLGMNIKFEICCVWLSGKFKWMLNSTSMGIHANFICDGGKISTEQVKQKALLMIRQILLDRLEEVDLQLEEYSA